MQINTTSYVLGFVFREDEGSVVLIRKEKPEWQRGYLNGVGGKVEPGETPIRAMIREFREETGVNTTANGWRCFCLMHGPYWEVKCFAMKSDEAWLMATTQESECVEKPPIRTLSPKQCISNLPWLLALALDNNGGQTPFADVEYKF